MLCVLLGTFSVLGGPECQISVIFRLWRRQVGIWASRGRFWGSKPGEILLWAPIWDGFWILLGSVFEVLFGRLLDHVFDDFGMILGSFLGSFS